MIEYRQGNLLDSDCEALVNTVNTVGVMGKGIALMFKERFPDNFEAYKIACAQNSVAVGKLFVFRRAVLLGPKWIINFPTKKHWRNSSKIEWIDEGLADLSRVIREEGIRSIAIPPLGAGNGGLNWHEVRSHIDRAFKGLVDIRVEIYEPTRNYQNVAKRVGTEKLTPARAMVADLVREYWTLGIECSLLEVQKLAYLAERFVVRAGLKNELDLRCKPHRYGPFSTRLNHLLNNLDGSYLHSEKRLADAGPGDLIWFENSRRGAVDLYLRTGDGRDYGNALADTKAVIRGFESPLGMELLATVDWLLAQEGTEPSVEGVRAALENWQGGEKSAQRKLRLFENRLIALALQRLFETGLGADPQRKI